MSTRRCKLVPPAPSSRAGPQPTSHGHSAPPIRPPRPSVRGSIDQDPKE